MAKTRTQTPPQDSEKHKPLKTPILDAMIQEARNTPPDQWVGHEELGRRLGLTEEERAAARSRIERRLREDADEAQADRTMPANGHMRQRGQREARRVT